MKGTLLAAGSYRLLVYDASEYAGRGGDFHVVTFHVLDADGEVEDQRQWVTKIGSPSDTAWSFLKTRVGKLVYARVVEQRVFLKGRREYVTVTMPTFADNACEVLQ